MDQDANAREQSAARKQSPSEVFAGEEDEMMKAKSSGASKSGRSLEEKKTNQKPRAVKRSNSYKKGITKRDGMPRRPLSAYNLFFKEQREVIIEERTQKLWEKQKAIGKEARKPKRAKIAFEDLAKIIGARWKSIDPQELARFRAEADRDSSRYKAEMEIFLKRGENEHEEEQPLTFEERNSDSGFQSEVATAAAVPENGYSLPSTSDFDELVPHHSRDSVPSSSDNNNTLQEHSIRASYTSTDFGMVNFLPSAHSSDAAFGNCPVSDQPSEQESWGLSFEYPAQTPSDPFGSQTHLKILFQQQQQQRQQPQHRSFYNPPQEQKFSAAMSQVNDEQLLRGHQEQFLVGVQKIHMSQIATSTERLMVHPLALEHQQLHNENQQIPFTSFSTSNFLHNNMPRIGAVHAATAGSREGVTTSDGAMSKPLDSTDMSWMEPRPFAPSPAPLAGQAQSNTNPSFFGREHDGIGIESGKEDHKQRIIHIT